MHPMENGYFRILFRCISISFAILIFVAINKQSMHWSSCIAGIAPLAYYHLLYLRPKAKTGLSQSAIDSVYYFGFLVTVGALGISAVSMAGDSNAHNMPTILLQFGIGLLATGYAVIARMHLTSISVGTDQLSSEEILNAYILKSKQLVDNVEIAIVRVKDFSEVIMKNVNETSCSSVNATKETCNKIFAEFQGEILAAATSTQSSIIEFQKVLSSSNITDEFTNLTTNIAHTSTTMKGLNESISEFTIATGLSLKIAEQTIATNELLQKSLSDLHSRFELFSTGNIAFNQATNSLADASSAISTGAAFIANSINDLSSLATATKGAASISKKLNNLTDKSYEQMDSIANVISRLKAVLDSLSITPDMRLIDGLDKAAIILPSLNTSAEALSSSLNRMSSISNNLSKQFEAIPFISKTLNEMADDSAGSVDTLIASVKEANRQTQSLNLDLAAAAGNVTSIEKLVANTSNIESAVNSVASLLESLEKSIFQTMRRLDSYSTTVNESVTTSTQVLSDNAKISSKAVSLLTDNLVQIAQTIIDKTNKRGQ